MYVMTLNFYHFIVLPFYIDLLYYKHLYIHL
jgi:hypothetical protein